MSIILGSFLIFVVAPTIIYWIFILATALIITIKDSIGRILHRGSRS